MSTHADLDALERDAYRASYADGIIDLFAGLALLWLGATWIWFEGIAPFAGILPAILVVPMLAARKRFVEARLGYVRWRAPRRRWERHSLWLVLAAGVIVLGIAVALLALGGETAGGVTPRDAGPGIMAWLLALMAAGLAILVQLSRALAYAAVLAATGLLAVLTGSGPGWPLLLSGGVVTACGALLLVRFARTHPVIEVS
jgi:hypothetical protein